MDVLSVDWEGLDSILTLAWWSRPITRTRCGDDMRQFEDICAAYQKEIRGVSRSTSSGFDGLRLQR